MGTKDPLYADESAKVLRWKSVIHPDGDQTGYDYDRQKIPQTAIGFELRLDLNGSALTDRQKSALQGTVDIARTELFKKLGLSEEMFTPGMIIRTDDRDRPYLLVSISPNTLRVKDIDRKSGKLFARSIPASAEFYEDLDAGRGEDAYRRLITRELLDNSSPPGWTVAYLNRDQLLDLTQDLDGVADDYWKLCFEQISEEGRRGIANDTNWYKDSAAKLRTLAPYADYAKCPRALLRLPDEEAAAGVACVTDTHALGDLAKSSTGLNERFEKAIVDRLDMDWLCSLAKTNYPIRDAALERLMIDASVADGHCLARLLNDGWWRKDSHHPKLLETIYTRADRNTALEELLNASQLPNSNVVLEILMRLEQRIVNHFAEAAPRLVVKETALKLTDNIVSLMTAWKRRYHELLILAKLMVLRQWDAQASGALENIRTEDPSYKGLVRSLLEGGDHPGKPEVEKLMAELLALEAEREKILAELPPLPQT